MPLNKSQLVSALQSVFESFPATESEAADGIAAAYADYAIGGTFGASTISSLASQESALAAALLGGLGSKSAAGAASAFSTGITAFWIGVVVTGGTTIGCPGAAALSALAGVWASNPSSAADAASQMGDLLDTATKTTTATVVIAGVPTVLPIT